MSEYEQKALIDLARLVHHLWLHGGDTHDDDSDPYGLGGCTARCEGGEHPYSHHPDCAWVKALKLTTGDLRKYVRDMQMHEPVSEYKGE